MSEVSADDLRRAIASARAHEANQRELARNPDFIKVWFIHDEGDDLAAQEAIVKAAGDAAHAAGKRLAVHATELLVAKAALRAGADFLVHSVFDVPVSRSYRTPRLIVRLWLSVQLSWKNAPYVGFMIE